MSYSHNDNNVSYLSFKIGDELFAANVSKVLSIIELTKLTKLPHAPKYVLGVINLRGMVLPIVDTHSKLGIAPSDEKTEGIIIVMEIMQENQKITLGALVDAVREVMEVDNSKIIPTPEIGGKFKSEFITGMIEDAEKYIMILDLDKIFTTDKSLSLFNDDYNQEDEVDINDDIDNRNSDDSSENTDEENINNAKQNSDEIAETWLQEAMASAIDDDDNKEETNDESDNSENNDDESNQIEIVETEDDIVEIETGIVVTETAVVETENENETIEADDNQQINEIINEQLEQQEIDSKDELFVSYTNDDNETTESTKFNEIETTQITDEKNDEFTTQDFENSIEEQINNADNINDTIETTNENTSETEENDENESAADKVLKRLNAKKKNKNKNK